MYVIIVTPLIRGTLKGTLTYFSKDPIKTGYLVTVPLRGREVKAIVIGSNDARNEKTILKNSDYRVKKIIHTKPVRYWDTLFIKAVEETSRTHLQGFGETLLALTPKAVFDTYFTEGRVDQPHLKRQPANNLSSQRTRAIQGDRNARIKLYRRLVHKSFEQGESIFICAPTQDDVEKIANEFSDTEKEKLFIFHSGIAKKKLLKRWGEAIRETRTFLVVGTPQYLSLPKHFATIILEDEHSRLWKTFTRPFIDARFFVAVFARETKSSLVLGAPILRIETHKKIIDGEIELIAAHTEAPQETLLIDPRIEEKRIKERTGARAVQILGEEIRATIKHAQENNKKMFLLVARKGLAPLVICGDCGTTIRCPVCDKLLVLHKKTGTRDARIFSCHSCGFNRAPEDGEHETCPTCGGWRLEALGIGIERIEDEIKRLFPSAECFVLDGDHTKTRTSARKTATLFEKSKRGILIGTPMAIPLLSTVDATAVVSLDSLFAIPDFRMHERIFALILTLREKTKGKFLVQTRIDDTALFKQALLGDTQSFVKNELMVRKTFSYPPYGMVIKITLRGSRLSAQAGAGIPVEMEQLKTFFSEYNPLVPQTMTHKKNIFQMHMILKFKEEISSDKKLFSKLHSLPPQFTLEINPDNLI